MKNYLKVLAVAVYITVISLIIFAIYKAVTTNYLVNSPFNSILILGILIVAVVLFTKSLRSILLLSLFGMVILGSGCQYAKSNQQVVISEDCGVNWRLIKQGESVPKAGVNPCYMKVVMPNYPMQGESAFISNLKDRVRANVHIDYDYSIINPLAFIKQAKFLGKANSDADDDNALNDKRFEGAENMVIDKRIKDVAKGIFINEDIVELDQSELENRLVEKSNTVLEPLGIQLNFITLTFDLDDQTRQAIDVSTAMKIYESKGLTDIGKSVIANRAGATKITVDTKVGQPEKASE